MDSYDFDKIGKAVKSMVEDAVDSKDFKDLSESIQQIANSASDIIKTTSTAYSSNYKGKRTYSSVVNRTEQFQTQKKVSPNNNAIIDYTDHRYFKNVVSPLIGYSFEAVFGLTFGLGFLMAFIGTILGGIFTFPDDQMVFLILDAVFGLISAGSLYAGISGCKKIKLTKRFERYIRTLHGKEYVNIDTISSYTNIPVKQVLADVKKLISQQWFVEGHLDSTNSCLMVTDKMYKEYLENERQSQALKIEAASSPIVKEEISEITKAKNEYLEKIHHCNDLIPGEEMTAKITAIENIVKRIFDRVEKHPESVSSIRKMMDYYLPTTIKLLEAYVELDSEPIVGDNIINSKKEIEESLDTLNNAFEKLLNELFKDTAWDVSSDISVLNTVLAQDGLKEN